MSPRAAALGLVGLLGVLGGPAGAGPALSGPPTERLERAGAAALGAPAPWFAGWTPDGQILNRTKLLARPGKGHVLLLFATWCKPCEPGLRAVSEAQAALAAVGLNVTLVAVGEPAEKVTPWLAARGLGEVPVLIDKFGTIAEALGARALVDGKQVMQLPRTVVLGPEGAVRAVLGREGPDFLDILKAGVDEAAAEAKPDPGAPAGRASKPGPGETGP